MQIKFKFNIFLAMPKIDDRRCFSVTHVACVLGGHWPADFKQAADNIPTQLNAITFIISLVYPD